MHLVERWKDGHLSEKILEESLHYFIRLFKYARTLNLFSKLIQKNPLLVRIRMLDCNLLAIESFVAVLKRSRKSL